jgi:hypothetical protein
MPLPIVLDILLSNLLLFSECMVFDYVKESASSSHGYAHHGAPSSLIANKIVARPTQSISILMKNSRASKVVKVQKAGFE